MARHVTEAICIYRNPYGDTSQIVHWLTRDLGREAALIRGAFREKNRYQGNEDLLDLFMTYRLSGHKSIRFDP